MGFFKKVFKKEPSLEERYQELITLLQNGDEAGKQQFAGIPRASIDVNLAAFESGFVIDSAESLLKFINVDANNMDYVAKCFEHFYLHPSNRNSFPSSFGYMADEKLSAQLSSLLEKCKNKIGANAEFLTSVVFNRDASAYYSATNNHTIETFDENTIIALANGDVMGQYVSSLPKQDMEEFVKLAAQKYPYLLSCALNGYTSTNFNRLAVFKKAVNADGKEYGPSLRSMSLAVLKPLITDGNYKEFWEHYGHYDKVLKERKIMGATILAYSEEVIDKNDIPASFFLDPNFVKAFLGVAKSKMEEFLETVDNSMAANATKKTLDKSFIDLQSFVIAAKVTAGAKHLEELSEAITKEKDREIQQSLINQVNELEKELKRAEELVAHNDLTEEFNERIQAYMDRGYTV